MCPAPLHAQRLRDLLTGALVLAAAMALGAALAWAGV